MVVYVSAGGKVRQDNVDIDSALDHNLDRPPGPGPSRLEGLESLVQSEPVSDERLDVNLRERAEII